MSSTILMTIAASFATTTARQVRANLVPPPILIKSERQLLHTDVAIQEFPWWKFPVTWEGD